MDRGFFRLVAAIVFVFVLTADLKTIMSPLMRVLNPVGRTPTKEVKIPKDESPIADNVYEDETPIKLGTPLTRASLMATIKNSCLPKLICELNATPNRERLSETERSLLNLIRDTSISITAETTSKYHFAAHMGQLIAGVEGTGCHNFYPLCPFPGLKVLQMMKKVKIR